MTRLLLLALALLCCVGCSSSSTLHVYNYTGQDVTVTVGSETLKVPAENVHKNFDVALKTGTKLSTAGDKGLKEEATVTETGANVIYNVGGKGELFVVDYTNCYGKEGDRPVDPPFKIAADLNGKQLYAAPAGRLVDANEAFPSEVSGSAKVFRVESIPQSLATHGNDAYIKQVLATEMKMRGHLYKK